MGKIVVSCMLSIDGFTEGSGGDVMAMPMDGTFGRHNAARVRTASSLVLGATTFRGMRAYWPQQVGNPEATEDDRYIAQRYADGIPITVVSDSLRPEEIDPWQGQTKIVPRKDAPRAIAELRLRHGEALIFGSRTLWNNLLRLGLVDELHLMVGPAFVAGDTPAFAGVPRQRLRLLDAHRPEDSELVLLSYAVEHHPGQSSGPSPATQGELS